MNESGNHDACGNCRLTHWEPAIDYTGRVISLWQRRGNDHTCRDHGPVGPGCCPGPGDHTVGYALAYDGRDGTGLHLGPYFERRPRGDIYWYREPSRGVVASVEVYGRFTTYRVVLADEERVALHQSYGPHEPGYWEPRRFQAGQSVLLHWRTNYTGHACEPAYLSAIAATEKEPAQ